MKQQNHKTQRSERRKTPRIERILPLTLKGERFFLTTETKNISASGAYCRVAQPIPELTQLGVTLLIPGEKGPPRRIAPHEIRCKGVVVRAEKILREGAVLESFFIAVTFTDLKKSDEETLLHTLGHPLKRGTASHGS